MALKVKVTETLMVAVDFYRSYLCDYMIILQHEKHVHSNINQSQ